MKRIVEICYLNDINPLIYTIWFGQLHPTEMLQLMNKYFGDVLWMSYVIPSTNLDNSSVKIISELHFLFQAGEVLGESRAEVFNYKH